MTTCRQSCRAFTIVELLIAAAITVIIVVMLGTMFGSLTSTSSRANQRIDAFRDARAALQMIERDLSNLVITQWEPDPFTAPPPATTSQPLTRPAAYLALKNIYADPTGNNQQIYALVASKNTGRSDICAVGYYCGWNPQKNAYSLYRFFRDSNSTYTTLSSPAPTPIPTPAGTFTYISDSALYQPAPTGTAADDVLASYVWNMRVVAYDESGTAMNYPYVCENSATIPTRPPAVLEVSFKAISPEAARTVTALTSDPNDWMDETKPNYLRLIKPHVYEFRTRIKL